MDKKADPKYIRFRTKTEIRIEEIAVGERKEFTEVVEMLVNIGLHEYDFIQHHFSIRPNFTEGDD